MEKITKHFKERITDLIILFIVICNYFGLLFIFNGSIIGVVLSLIFSLLIGVSCWYVKEKLIENKNINFKNKLINKFILLWVSFIIIGLFNYVIISHIYNINFTYKEKIQKNVSEKLSSVQAYSDELKIRGNDDIYNYWAKLKEEAKTQHPSLSPTQTNDIANSGTDPIRTQFISNCSKIENTIKSTNLKFRKVFNEWHVTDLMKNYNDLIEYSKENYKNINLQLNDLPFDKSPLKETLNINNLPLNNPFQLNAMLSEGLNSYLIPFLLILITHLIVLAPYFKTPTEETNGGKEPEGAYIIEL